MSINGKLSVIVYFILSNAEDSIVKEEFLNTSTALTLDRLLLKKSQSVFWKLADYMKQDIDWNGKKDWVVSLSTLTKSTLYLNNVYIAIFWGDSAANYIVLFLGHSGEVLDTTLFSRPIFFFSLHHFVSLQLSFNSLVDWGSLLYHTDTKLHTDTST